MDRFEKDDVVVITGSCSTNDTEWKSTCEDEYGNGTEQIVRGYNGDFVKLGVCGSYEENALTLIARDGLRVGGRAIQHEEPCTIIKFIWNADKLEVWHRHDKESTEWIGEFHTFTPLPEEGAEKSPIGYVFMAGEDIERGDYLTYGPRGALVKARGHVDLSELKATSADKLLAENEHLKAEVESLKLSRSNIRVRELEKEVEELKAWRDVIKEKIAVSSRRTDGEIPLSEIAYRLSDAVADIRETIDKM